MGTSKAKTVVTRQKSYAKHSSLRNKLALGQDEVQQNGLNFKLAWYSSLEIAKKTYLRKIGLATNRKILPVMINYGWHGNLWRSIWKITFLWENTTRTFHCFNPYTQLRHRKPWKASFLWSLMFVQCAPYFLLCINSQNAESNLTENTASVRTDWHYYQLIMWKPISARTRIWSVFDVCG